MWVSATKQASHTHKLFTLRRKNGYREAWSCLLCPRWGGRRVQRSLFLSPVPTLRRKKGTEKLAPVTCAHAAAEEGAQAEFVLSTTPLRYEPCTQFINVSQRALHIYFIDGCRRIKSKTKTATCEQAPRSLFLFWLCMARNSQFTCLVQLFISQSSDNL